MDCWLIWLSLDLFYFCGLEIMFFSSDCFQMVRICLLIEAKANIISNWLYTSILFSCVYSWLTTAVNRHCLAFYKKQKTEELFFSNSFIFLIGGLSNFQETLSIRHSRTRLGSSPKWDSISTLSFNTAVIAHIRLLNPWIWAWSRVQCYINDKQLPKQQVSSLYTIYVVKRKGSGHYSLTLTSFAEVARMGLKNASLRNSKFWFGIQHCPSLQLKTIILKCLILISMFQNLPSII